jgi:hypothetical protein
VARTARPQRRSPASFTIAAGFMAVPTASIGTPCAVSAHAVTSAPKRQIWVTITTTMHADSLFCITMGPRQRTTFGMCGKVGAERPQEPLLCGPAPPVALRQDPARARPTIRDARVIKARTTSLSHRPVLDPDTREGCPLRCPRDRPGASTLAWRTRPTLMGL